MSYAIVYSSRTGNTARLAKALQEFLPEQDCVYVGAPDPQALSADTLYVGFWTDKGTCDAETAGFLPNLNGQSVFLFGTAGFGGDATYFARILDRVKALLARRGSPYAARLCARAKCPQRCAPAMKPWPVAPSARPCWKISTGRCLTRIKRTKSTCLPPLRPNRKTPGRSP